MLHLACLVQELAQVLVLTKLACKSNDSIHGLLCTVLICAAFDKRPDCYAVSCADVPHLGARMHHGNVSLHTLSQVFIAQVLRPNCEWSDLHQRAIAH